VHVDNSVNVDFSISGKALGLSFDTYAFYYLVPLVIVVLLLAGRRAIRK
jgi:hypothetical protein